MSNWKVGPGGRLYHPTTGAYVGQLDDNGNEQFVLSAFPSDEGVAETAAGIAIPSRSAIATAARLIALHRAQATEDALHGPLNLARAALPAAADQPTITSSTTAPSADADVAARTIYPFGLDDSSRDPIPPSRLTKGWIRGFSEALRAYGASGNSLRLSASLSNYLTDGAQLQDPLLSYGIAQGIAEIDVILHSDVLFLRLPGGAAGMFELFINEGLYTTVGTGMATSNSRAIYQISAGWVKIKFGTVAQRRVTLRFQNQYVPSSLHVRRVATICPAISTPLKWGHIGDSFSYGSGATTRTQACAEWLRLAYGLGIDFINSSLGGSSFAGNSTAGVNKPGDVPTSGLRASLRTQWQLNLRNVAGLDVITVFDGQNEDSTRASLVTSEVTALLNDIYSVNAGALVFVIGSNASPTTIANGSAVAAENALAAGVAASINPNAVFVPLQTATEGAFLSGTGKVGAETGLGNSDVITGTDGAHPPDLGHQLYGQRIARGVYDGCCALISKF